MSQSIIIENKHKLPCPECMNEIDLTQPSYSVGFVMECPYCGTTLEVIQINENGTINVESVEFDK